MKPRPIVAEDLMTPDVLAVDEEMSVAELAAFLRRHEISGAAVKDSAGKVVGVVSLADVASAAAEGEAGGQESGINPFYLRDLTDRYAKEDIARLHLEGEKRRVADIMTPSVYSVEHDTPLPEIAHLMLEAHIHRLLVLRDGEPVGVVSTTDLLGVFMGQRVG